MKSSVKTKPKIKKIPRKAYTINPSLQGKYDNDPYFKEKVDRANEILKKFPLPQSW